ncbi:MAG: hypothetical protein FVQ85_14125 [Planctomycetes bacterium]|nr:hypothetical protein [Planctomycetota bacterium]
MNKVTVLSAVIIIVLAGNSTQAGVSLMMNGSFESDGVINDVAVEAPRRWCDVNIPSDKFGGWINTFWKTRGDYSLSLYSGFVEFTAGDMATVSQQVYLADVNQIIFDLRLSTIAGYMWDPGKRSALILIDGDVVWDSGDWVPDASGEYRNQMVDVNEIYKDESPHTLSLAMKSNVSETEWFYQFLAQWDFIKFDTYCGGFGYLAEDLNYDCYVDELDLKLMTGQWLAEELNQEYDLFDDQEFIISFPDFATFSSYWQDTNCPQTVSCRGSDFNRSGAVDFTDLMIFADHWLGEVVFLLSDLAEDDMVNFKDFAGLAGRWRDNTDWRNWQDENCFELELPASDLNYDGIVNLRDLAIIIGDLGSEGPCFRSDIDGSEVVDYGDFSQVIDGWLLKSWLYGVK